MSQKLSETSISGLTNSQTSTSTINDSKRTCSDFKDELLDAKIRKIDFFTLDIISTLDRTQITGRQAMYLISAFMKGLGLNIDDFNISYSTIRRHRIKFRKEIFEELKENANLPENITVHWDGKQLPDTKTTKDERLPI